MMGRTTLREVREALAAARSGEAKPPSASPTADELESLARLLERGAIENPVAPPMAEVSAEVPPQEPSQALQQTGHATDVFEALAELARRYPDWRVGQLVANVADWADAEVWDAEDEQLLSAARAHLGSVSGLNGGKPSANHTRQETGHATDGPS